MAECKFIIERHGQSEGNLVRAFLGHTDLPLSELGHRQAAKTAEFLKDENIDVMLSSDLKRAYQTAEPLARLKGMEIIPDKGLREIYAGKWENMLFDDIQATYPEEFGVWRNDIGNAVCTGGEAVRDLDSRIYKEICRLGETYAGKTVFIATHATPIRMLRIRALGLPIEDAKDHPWAPNASVTVIGYENGKFRLIRDTVSEHLDDLITHLPKNV